MHIKDSGPHQGEHSHVTENPRAGKSKNGHNITAHPGNTPHNHKTKRFFLFSLIKNLWNYLIRPSNKQLIITPPKPPSSQPPLLDIKKQDALALDEMLNQQVPGSAFSFNSTEHDGAWIIIGKDGSGKSRVLNQLAEANLAKENASLRSSVQQPEAHHVNGEKFLEIGGLCFVSGSQTWKPTEATADLPKKIEHAEKCVFCLPASASRFTNEIDEKAFLFLIRHLPKNEDGAPDLSKLHIALSFADSTLVPEKEAKQKFLDAMNELLQAYGKALHPDQLSLIRKTGAVY